LGQQPQHCSTNGKPRVLLSAQSISQTISIERSLLRCNSEPSKDSGESDSPPTHQLHYRLSKKFKSCVYNYLPYLRVCLYLASVPQTSNCPVLSEGPYHRDISSTLLAWKLGRTSYHPNYSFTSYANLKVLEALLWPLSPLCSGMQRNFQAFHIRIGLYF